MFQENVKRERFKGKVGEVQRKPLFSLHPKNQTVVVLRVGCSLDKGSFTRKHEEEGFRNEGLKDRWLLKGRVSEIKA